MLKPIEGTILTVVAGRGRRRDGEPPATAARSSACCDAARASAREALADTPDLLPVLKDAGVVDAGGAGFLLLLDAALHVVDGEPLPEPDDGPGAVRRAARGGGARATAAGDGEVDVCRPALRGHVLPRPAPTTAIDVVQGRAGARIGDSIVVVGGDGLWNCHVHTNDIGAAIEVALDLDGRPRTIRVTDLFEEVAEEHAHREAALHGGHPPFTGHATSLPPVTCRGRRGRAAATVSSSCSATSVCRASSPAARR